MKYGLIGERLGHSFSAEIHREVGGYEYSLTELSREELDGFLLRRDFAAINVTIPYKEAVLPYLYRIDEEAARIGAVNTVVNRDGLLYGYNTDFFGMRSLIAHAGTDISGRKVAILGTGGTSKTARAVAESLGAREIVTVSRTARGSAVDYAALYEHHADTEVLINTTPVGMYPSVLGCPVELDRLAALCGVVDAVYNPLRTRLVSEARSRGIAAEGGLYMLVAQAVRASEIFLDCSYPEKTVDRVYRRILRGRENVVLIGMPSSGKSTVGAILAEALCRPLLDTDQAVTERTGRTPAEIISTDGEEKFRIAERQAVTSAAAETAAVIATGGGAVLDPDNLKALRMNGRLYFIDRPLACLTPTADRPLSPDAESLAARYRERYPIYAAAADCTVDADCTPREVAAKILEDFNK